MIEGYWYSSWDPNHKFAKPIPNELTQEQAGTIFELIRVKEAKAKDVAYRGSSSSRITGEMLGSHEYELDGWRWPGDFAEHYVLKYRVKPTDEFLKFIGYSE